MKLLVILIVGLFGLSVSDYCYALSVTDRGVYSTSRTELEFQILDANDIISYEYSLTTSPSPPVAPPPIQSLLTIGDSITYSPPGYWNGNQSPGWGMNASTATSDYVHLLLARFQSLNPTATVTHYTSTGAHQEGGKITDIINKLEVFKSYKAELITLQIGENDGALTVPDFLGKYALVLDSLLDNTPRPKILCVGVWTCKASYAPETRQYLMESGMASICAARGIAFRSLAPIATHPLNINNGGNNAIDWHPNDSGMQGYADLFWDAYGGATLDWQSSSAVPSAITGLHLIEGYTYYIHVRGKRADGTFTEIATTDGIAVDSTPPYKPLVTSPSIYTTTPDEIEYNVSTADFGSGLASLEYAVGTNWSGPGGLIIPWTTTEPSNKITATAPYIPGTAYFCYVRAKDNLGNCSQVGASTGVKVVEYVCDTPGKAKTHADSTAVALKDVVVSGRFTSESGFFYVQDPKRSSGIRVSCNWPLLPGNIVTLAGKLATTATGERYIENRINTLTVTGSTSPPKPLIINGQAILFDDFYVTTPTTGQQGNLSPNAVHLNAVGLYLELCGIISECSLNKTTVLCDNTPVTLDITAASYGLLMGDRVRITGFLLGDANKMICIRIERVA